VSAVPATGIAAKSRTYRFFMNCSQLYALYENRDQAAAAHLPRPAMASSMATCSGPVRQRAGHPLEARRMALAIHSSKSYKVAGNNKQAAAF
jgi:hypothetical protein